ncbi:MAG TPA: sigma-70 family RNA polymerase sigma factor [Candidatus Limiplasma stercoravium]|nr:sigma-70 family RNA polymerase sigma factor [Candidatus Limiplasma stercoravium]
MQAAEREDQDRLERMMRLHGDALVRMCYLYLHDFALAQDAAQETFVKAWRRMGDFRGACSERTWLMRVAINTCRDIHRTAWMRHVDRGTTLDSLPEAGAEDAHPDGEVLKAVMALPRREREAVLLRYYQEMTLEEAAQALGISQSAVKQRLQRANRRLRERLKEWYEDA